MPAMRIDFIIISQDLEVWVINKQCSVKVQWSGEVSEGKGKDG